MSLAACQPRLCQTTPHNTPGTPGIPASQCQPSGTYRQVPSHGVAFCPFERRAVSSHRPCLSGSVPVRVISVYCAFTVDHDAVQLRHHMYASWARIALSITPRRRTLGAADLEIQTHVCCMHCEFPPGLTRRGGHCTFSLHPSQSTQVPVEPYIVYGPKKKWALHSSTAPHADDAVAGTIAAATWGGLIAGGAGMRV